MPMRPVLHEGNRVLDHYKSFDEFKADLLLAGDRARTVEARDFVKSLQDRYRTHGEKLYLSKSQANWLQDIANSAK